MRLVGVGVADGGHDGDPAGPVQRGQGAGGRVPVQLRVGGGRRSRVRAQGEVAAQPVVVGVGGGREEGQGVDPALEEDLDEDGSGGAGRGLGHPVVEQRELRGAVHREGEAGAAEQDRAAGQAGARGDGHPGLDRGEAVAGAGGGADGLGAGVVAAVHGQLTGGRGRWPRAPGARSGAGPDRRRASSPRLEVPAVVGEGVQALRRRLGQGGVGPMAERALDRTLRRLVQRLVVLGVRVERGLLERGSSRRPSGPARSRCPASGCRPSRPRWGARRAVWPACWQIQVQSSVSIARFSARSSPRRRPRAA